MATAGPRAQPMVSAAKAHQRETTMLNDDESVSWDELELDELHELLADELPTLSPEQTSEIADLLSAAGGLDAARQMLEQLAGGAQEGKRSAA